jgi:nitrate reductase NapAB chaperone NapD
VIIKWNAFCYITNQGLGLTKIPVVLPVTHFLFPISGLRMAISGVVITVSPSDKREVEIALSKFSELQVYGSDEDGNIIATIKSLDKQSMEEMIARIEKLNFVSQVHIAYLKNDDVPCTFE